MAQWTDPADIAWAQGMSDALRLLRRKSRVHKRAAADIACIRRLRTCPLSGALPTDVREAAEDKQKYHASLLASERRRRGVTD